MFFISMLGCVGEAKVLDVLLHAAGASLKYAFTVSSLPVAVISEISKSTVAEAAERVISSLSAPYSTISFFEMSALEYVTVPLIT